MSIGTEYQPIGSKDWYSSSDKELRDSVRAVVSRGGFAMNTQSIDSTYPVTLDYRFSVFYANTTTAPLTNNLPYANSLGVGKVVYLRLANYTGTNTWSVLCQGADLVTGGVFTNKIVISPGDIWELVSDGVSQWYARRLTDYQEGDGTALEWTPTLTFTTPGNLSVVYSTQVGDWTKVGRVIIANFRISTSTFTYTTSAGNLIITGLPYPAATVTNGVWAGALVFGGITAAAGYSQLTPQVTSGSSSIVFTSSGFGVAAATLNTGNVASGNTVVLRGNIIYHI